MTQTNDWVLGSSELITGRFSMGATTVVVNKNNKSSSTRIVVVGGMESMISENWSIPHCRADTVEYIDFQHLYPSWTFVGHYIMLRQLYEQGRATPTTANPTHSATVVERFVTELDEALFRHVLSFLLYDIPTTKNAEE